MTRITATPEARIELMAPISMNVSSLDAFVRVPQDSDSPTPAD